MPTDDLPSPDVVVDNLRELVSANYRDHERSFKRADDAVFEAATAIHIRAGALIARLKALNRTANAATRTRKQATADARHEMDQAHLGLQNLLYEKRHLEREIDKCRQFASIYQDIPLYSLEEFERLAPPEARTDDVLANEHQLMLNRLSFELAERQRLDLKKKELALHKEELLKQSKVKAATLESIKLQIDTLMKVASETQKKVDELVLPASSNSTPAP